MSSSTKIQQDQAGQDNSVNDTQDETKAASANIQAMAVSIAFASFVFSDIALNVIHTCSRALIIDTLPLRKQSRGWGWASRMTCLGYLLGYLLSHADLVSTFHGFLGSTQLKSLAVLSSILLFFSMGITTWTVDERIQIRKIESYSARTNWSIRKALSTISNAIQSTTGYTPLEIEPTTTQQNESQNTTLGYRPIGPTQSRISASGFISGIYSMAISSFNYSVDQACHAIVILFKAGYHVPRNISVIFIIQMFLGSYWSVVNSYGGVWVGELWIKSDAKKKIQQHKDALGETGIGTNPGELRQDSGLKVRTAKKLIGSFWRSLFKRAGESTTKNTSHTDLAEVPQRTNIEQTMHLGGKGANNIPDRNSVVGRAVRQGLISLTFLSLVALVVTIIIPSIVERLRTRREKLIKNRELKSSKQRNNTPTINILNSNISNMERAYGHSPSDIQLDNIDTSMIRKLGSRSEASSPIATTNSISNLIHDNHATARGSKDIRRGLLPSSKAPGIVKDSTKRHSLDPRFFMNFNVNNINQNNLNNMKNTQPNSPSNSRISLSYQEAPNQRNVIGKSRISSNVSMIISTANSIDSPVAPISIPATAPSSEVPGSGPGITNLSVTPNMVSPFDTLNNTSSENSISSSNIIYPSTSLKIQRPSSPLAAMTLANEDNNSQIVQRPRESMDNASILSTTSNYSTQPAFHNGIPNRSRNVSSNSNINDTNDSSDTASIQSYSGVTSSLLPLASTPSGHLTSQSSAKSSRGAFESIMRFLAAILYVLSTCIIVPLAFLARVLLAPFRFILRRIIGWFLRQVVLRALRGVVRLFDVGDRWIDRKLIESYDSRQKRRPQLNRLQPGGSKGNICMDDGCVTDWMVRIWIVSQFAYCLIMLSVPYITNALNFREAKAMLALIGVSKGVTEWVSYSVLGEEILKETEGDGATGAILDGKKIHTTLATLGEHEDEEDLLTRGSRAEDIEEYANHQQMTQREDFENLEGSQPDYSNQPYQHPHNIGSENSNDYLDEEEEELYLDLITNDFEDEQDVEVLETEDEERLIYVAQPALDDSLETKSPQSYMKKTYGTLGNALHNAKKRYRNLIQYRPRRGSDSSLYSIASATSVTSRRSTSNIVGRGSFRDHRSRRGHRRDPSLTEDDFYQDPFSQDVVRTTGAHAGVYMGLQGAASAVGRLITVAVCYIVIGLIDGFDGRGVREYLGLGIVTFGSDSSSPARAGTGIVAVLTLSVACGVTSAWLTRGLSNSDD